jgi:hypothetical protein
VYLAMGLTSVFHPMTKWVYFLEACALTGFCSVLGAGLAAPNFKTAVKLIAIAAPLTYWLLEARQNLSIVTSHEVLIVIVGIVGGGVGAWYLLERWPDANGT